MRKKHLPLLFLVTFLMMLGFGIIIPILPFFAEKLGAGSFQIGLLFSSYNVMQFLFAPVWGSLSDRVGRKPLVVLGLLGFAVTFFLFGLSDSYAQMLAYRILGGIVTAAAIPSVQAMVADWFPPSERAKGMGMLGAATGLSFVFGPVIGGLLSQAGYSYPFFASAAVALLTLAVVVVVLPESLPADKRTATPISEKRANPVAALTGPLSLLYAILFVVSFAFAGLETTFALYIGDLYKMTSKDLGYMFLVMGLIAAFVQGGLIGRMVKRWGEPAVLSLGLSLYVAGFIAILFGSGFWSFSLYLSLFGAGQGMIRATGTAMITQRTRQGQGATSGAMSSMDSLGRIAGPAAGSAVYAWHPSLPYLMGAVLVLIMLLLFAARYRHLPDPVQSDPRI